MSDIELKLRYPESKLEDITDAYMRGYENGYRDGSIHYELAHCPACKNVVDLQEALEESAKLRELVRSVYMVWHCRDCDVCPWADECDTDGGCPWLSIFGDHMRELGIEVKA